MNNQAIENLYYDYINSTEYEQTAERHDMLKRDGEYLDYLEETLKQFMSYEENAAFTETTVEWACACERRAFVLGFKYASKLMINVFEPKIEVPS